MKTVLLLHADYSHARWFSEFKVYKQFLRSTYRSGEWQESKYSNLAGTLFVEVQVPSRQPGFLKSRVRISRGLDQCTHQSMPKDTKHHNSGAVFSPQAWSCGRPRAQTTGGPSPGTKLRQIQRLYRLDAVSNSNQQRWTLKTWRMNLRSHQDGRNFARRTAVIRRCVQSRRRLQATISTTSLQKTKKPEIQVQILKLDQISWVFMWDYTYIYRNHVAPTTKLYVP